MVFISTLLSRVVSHAPALQIQQVLNINARTMPDTTCHTLASRQHSTKLRTQPAAQDISSSLVVVAAVIGGIEAREHVFVWAMNSLGRVVCALLDAMGIPREAADLFLRELVACTTTVGITALGCRCYGTSLAAFTRFKGTWGATCMGLLAGLLGYLSEQLVYHGCKAIVQFWPNTFSTRAVTTLSRVLSPALQAGDFIAVALPAAAHFILAPLWEELFCR
jgi:hypothetical protein